MMASLEKIIETAKKLGIEVIEEAETPGFLLEIEGEIRPLRGREILKACTHYSDEELNNILIDPSSWTSEQTIKPVTLKQIVVKQNLFEVKQQGTGGLLNVC